MALLRRVLVALPLIVTLAGCASFGSPSGFRTSSKASPVTPGIAELKMVAPIAPITNITVISLNFARCEMNHRKALRWS